MERRERVEHIVLTCIFGIAAFCDYREDRIPNGLCFFGCILGCLLITGQQSFQNGISTLLSRILPVIGLGVILFPLWMIGAVGGGDLKLIGISTLILGKDVFSFLACGGICIGLHACLLMARRGNYMRRMGLLFQYVISCFQKRKLEPYPFSREKDRADGGIRISYGLLAGHLLAWGMGMYC